MADAKIVGEYRDEKYRKSREEFMKRYKPLAEKYRERFGEEPAYWDVSGRDEMIRLIEEALRTGKTIWEIQTENLPPDTIL